MNNLNNLYYSLNRYYSLLSSVRSAVATLSSPSNKLGMINKDITSYFNYDGVGVDNNRVINTKNSIDAIIQKINNEVIPAINSQIYSINREIEDLEKEAAGGN